MQFVCLQYSPSNQLGYPNLSSGIPQAKRQAALDKEEQRLQRQGLVKKWEKWYAEGVNNDRIW